MLNQVNVLFHNKYVVTVHLSHFNATTRLFCNGLTPEFKLFISKYEMIWCLHTNWILRVNTHRCSSSETTSFEKYQSIAYICIFKTFLQHIFLIIINAPSFMWVAINETVCWTALLLWRYTLCGMEKRMRCVLS